MRAQGYMKHLQIDIVHAFLPGPCILGGMAARMARIPLIVGSRRSLPSQYRAGRRTAGWADTAAFNLAHFNLGSVLEEVGRLEAARLHLRNAVRLDPSFPDAHYNLAFVCEKLGAQNEAQRHWQAFITLDPSSPWCSYARQRLSSSIQAKSIAGIQS